MIHSAGCDVKRKMLIINLDNHKLLFLKIGKIGVWGENLNSKIISSTQEVQRGLPTAITVPWILKSGLSDFVLIVMDLGISRSGIPSLLKSLI